jgi:tetratricopeptide (TPR) repeat protein
MSRFSSLEFNNEEGSQFDRAPSALKDESFYLNEANGSFEAGRFEDALRSYSKVLEYNPKNVSAWAGQVRMLIELGEFPEAKLWADKALEQFQNEPELLAAKAVALGRLGDAKGALAFSDASIEERGDTPYVWLARGDVLLSRREKRAEFCFQKAIGMSPANWFTQWLTSRIYSYYRKYSIAMKHAQEALNFNPGQSVVWLQAGCCQMELGLVTLAENSLTQAKQLDPHCQRTNKALAALSDTGFWSKLRRRFFSR